MNFLFFQASIMSPFQKRVQLMLANVMDASLANTIKGHAPLRASQTLRSALRMRGKSVGSITYFYSAKNDQDVVFSSDLEFAHGLLLEADETVKSYDVDPDRVIAFIEGKGYLGSKPDAIVKLWSGRTRYVEVKYLEDQRRKRAVLQAEIQKRVADSVNADWCWFSEKDVQAKNRLLHDWLHIAPVLAQSRVEVKSRWEHLMKWVLEASREATTLGNLKRCTHDPWELVFSTTVLLVQLGKLRSDLEMRPLSAETMIAPRDVIYA
ncbi:hypothetical protein [Comamonas thiooxydans]|uniref:hypothetical protein n=2 Tax=Comamonas TaxID=283 RepID=UPI00111247CC|nr:hypothetical protein [Comamonas thiooxydans]